jgi:LysM repeat protein
LLVSTFAKTVKILVSTNHNFAMIFLLILLACSLSTTVKAQNFEQQALAILKSNDLNRDGRLSGDEVDFSFRLRRFRKVDLNGDGYLDKFELTKSYEQAYLAKQQYQQNNTETQKVDRPRIIEKLIGSSPSQNTTPNIADSGQRYTVRPGDSLYSIAKFYQVSVSDLMYINQINDETRLPIDKILIIPASQN